MKVKEIGNLTADPTYGEKDDVKYCNFTLAINNPYNRDDTEFVRVSTFGKQAESCRDFLQKGSQVCVEGRVKADAFINGKDEAQATFSISASEVQFLNRIKQREGQSKIDAAIRNAKDNSTHESQNQSHEMAR